MATTVFQARTHTVSAGLSRARWSTVHIDTESGSYTGRVYIPETKKRLSDVLCDDRPFLFVTEVTVDHGEHVEPFLAINKRFIKSVRVLHEGEAEAIPLALR